MIAPPPFPRGPNMVGRFGWVEHGGRGVYERSERVEGRERGDWKRRHGGGDAPVRSERRLSGTARLISKAVAIVNVEAMALSLKPDWTITAWELVKGGRGGGVVRGGWAIVCSLVD